MISNNKACMLAYLTFMGLVLLMTTWIATHHTKTIVHIPANTGINAKLTKYNNSAHNTTPLFINTESGILACVGITFKPTSDLMKHVAHKNTANMYKQIKTVLAFLVITNNTSDDELNIWRTAGHRDETVLNSTSTNQHGTPFLSSILHQVEKACPKSTPFVAYANADILFDSGLERTLEALVEWSRSNSHRMMAVGRRSNHYLSGKLTPNDISRVQSDLEVSVAQDYFIMTRSLINWNTMPSFVIGRRAYDNILVDWAYHHSLLVDVTDTVLALHQTTADGNRAGHSDANPDKEFNVLLQGVLPRSYDHGSTDNAQYRTMWTDNFKTVRVYTASESERVDGGQQRPPSSHSNAVGKWLEQFRVFRHLLILMGRGMHLKQWMKTVTEAQELNHVDMIVGIFDNTVQSLDCPATSERVLCIQVSGTTWTTGRNALARAAYLREIELGRQYTIWTFGDADVVLKCTGEGGCLTVYDHFLRKLPAEVLAVALLGHGQWESTTNAVMVELQAYDAAWNSMRREAVFTLLPYRPEEDHNTWWSSQAILWNRLQCLEPLYAVAPLFVFYVNTEHGDYPRNRRNLAEERRLADAIMGRFSSVLAKAPIEYEDQFRQDRVRTLPLIIDKPVSDTFRLCHSEFSGQFHSFALNGSIQEALSIH